ncbi:MAG: MFS transporter [Chloroflexi bacterium]|nr:MFS transporter [Chloroflexota bacterium]
MPLPYQQAAAYYLAFIALGLTAASLGPTLPGLATQTRSALNEISFLFTARAFGYLVGSYFGGRAYDRIPGHRLMAAMLALIAAMMALAPLLAWLPALTAALFVLGMGEGALDVGGNTLIVWAIRERVGPFMNALHFFFGIGAFLSPLVVAAAIILSGGIAGAYWALSLLFIPCIAWLFRLPPPAARHAEQHGGVVRTNRLLLALIVIFFFGNSGAESAFGGWVYSYAVALRLSDETVAAYLTSLFWGTFTLGRLLAIPLSMRVRPAVLIAIDLAGCLLCIGLIGAAGSSSFVLTAIGAAGVGLCMASIFPMTISLAARHMTITGAVTGWFFVGASAGNMLIPWLIGQWFEPAGPGTLPLVLGVDVAACCVLFALVAWRDVQLSAPQPTIRE